MSKFVYILIRLDDSDYPVEAVFSNLEEAEKYRDDLIAGMREYEEIDEHTDADKVFEIISRLLHEEV